MAESMTSPDILITLGEVRADSKSAKHAANSANMKIDAVNSNLSSEIKNAEIRLMDSITKLTETLATSNMENAINRTKIGFVVGIMGGLSGICGSLAVMLISYWIKP